MSIKSEKVEVPQAAEFFGKLLFDDTEGWPLTDAGYQLSPSCIVDLSRGPFNGVLTLSTAGKEKTHLLDRDTEMQDVVNKVVARAKILKRRTSSDKNASPALLTAQAPGSGKSHFLAELGVKIPSLWDLDGQKQRPLVSAFTYGSAMGNKLTHGSVTSTSEVDLAQRVLYGAAHHMTRAGLHCTSWMGFLDAIHAAVSSSILASLVNLNVVVKILHHLHGVRPLVILALSGGSVAGSIADIGDMGTNLPPQFRAEELEELLQSWELVDCPSGSCLKSVA
ncbi:unnamed protein product [Symbiodinium sp. CCMP2592]|nr:unnamed protein product [Symbiodinium sp. CCMP2592]